jgi:hypothetical protein
MKNLTIYRVISYIILFIAAFLSVGVFTSLLAALANPVALLPIFLMACVIIYTYCSWRFLVRGIDKNIASKPVLRDLIKVNGYITLALAAFILFQTIVVLFQPQLVRDMTAQVKAAQPAGAEVSDETLAVWIHVLIRCLLGYCTLLLIHTVITFRLLKRFPQAFAEPSN